MDSTMLNLENQEVFDEIEWLRGFLGASIDTENLEPVYRFLLLWNLFEYLVCKTNYHRDTVKAEIRRLHSSGKLEVAHFQDFLNHFQDRYSDNHRFDALKWKNLHDKQLVKCVLSKDTQDTEEIILAIILIVHRLRNNLFHGSKALVSLASQSKNFSVANQVLAKFLEVGAYHP